MSQLFIRHGLILERYKVQTDFTAHIDSEAFWTTSMFADAGQGRDKRRVRDVTSHTSNDTDLIWREQ